MHKHPLIPLPENLLGHPQGNNVRNWDIYVEYTALITASKSKNIYHELIEECLTLYSMYVPDSTDKYNQGIGRNLFALQQSLLDKMPQDIRLATTMINMLPSTRITPNNQSQKVRTTQLS